MTYYQLLPSIEQECSIYKDPYVPNNADFTGELIPQNIFEKPLEFITRCTSESPPDDYPGSMIKVLPDRFIKAFQQAGVDNMQLYNATLVNPDTGDKWDSGYKAVNFVGIIDCVDMEKAEGDEIGAGMVAFNRIGIDLSKTKGALVFTIPQARTSIIIHERVLDFFDELRLGLTGMKYRKCNS